jgi:hypothetical protein
MKNSDEGVSTVGNPGGYVNEKRVVSEPCPTFAIAACQGT